MKAIVVGNPLDPAVEQGPVVSKEQYDKIMKYIQKGTKEGAKLATGGNRIGEKGWYI